MYAAQLFDFLSAHRSAINAIDKTNVIIVAVFAAAAAAAEPPIIIMAAAS